MSLVSSRIPNFLGGVSQQAPHLREPNEFEALVNAYVSRTKGLGKRPGTAHVAELDTGSGYDNATLTPLDYGQDERFNAIFLDGDLKVFDLDGVEQTVTFPSGKAYLGTTDTKPVIRTVSVGPRTFVLNREVSALRDRTKKASIPAISSLLYIETADYSTTYFVTIDGVTVSYLTATGTEPGARSSIATDEIADEIVSILSTAFTAFEFTAYGSMILVERINGGEFSISTGDGLADNGLRAVKGRIQRASDLPLRCLNGYVLEVSGDPESESDNYWVAFDADGTPGYNGTWKECVRPGEATHFNAATMPHELVYSKEVTPLLEAKGIPSQPSVQLADPVLHDSHWADTLNGTALGYTQLAGLGAGATTDAFLNLGMANGSPIKVRIKYSVRTGDMTGSTNSLVVTFSYNNGAASTTWTLAATLNFSPGVTLDNQIIEFDVPASMGVNYDIKAEATYSGSTPSDPDEYGYCILRSYAEDGAQYTIYNGRDIVLDTSKTYPLGTVWTTISNGQTATYTQTADLTGTALATALQPGIDALGLTIATNPVAGTVRCTNSSGTGIPDLTCVGVLDSKRYWNPDVLLGYAADALVGKTLRNLSDGSQGTVDDSYDYGIRVSSLTGGVQNTIQAGDRIVVEGSSKEFTFRPVAWKERAAGSSITNPWPSFIDTTIADIFYHKGRLGFLSGQNVIYSRAGVPEGLFKEATAVFLDSDNIDVTWTAGESSPFHSAVAWNETVVFLSKTAMAIPTSSGVFSAASIGIETLVNYASSEDCEPVAADRWIFFARPFSTEVQLQALSVSQRSQRPEALSVVEHVPTYLNGSPRLLVADPDKGFLFVQTNGDPSKLYVLRYLFSEDNRNWLSWNTWQFTGDILGASVDAGVLGLVIKYPDGVCYETLDLSENY